MGNILGHMGNGGGGGREVVGNRPNMESKCSRGSRDRCGAEYDSKRKGQVTAQSSEMGTQSWL